jgi:hypothetical protein
MFSFLLVGLVAHCKSGSQADRPSAANPINNAAGMAASVGYQDAVLLCAKH